MKRKPFSSPRVHLAENLISQGQTDLNTKASHIAHHAMDHSLLVKDVAVVGGGNAGFESASQLLAYCKSVTLLSRSDFKADPATIDTILANPKMKAIKNAVPKEVLGN